MPVVLGEKEKRSNVRYRSSGCELVPWGGEPSFAALCTKVYSA